METCYRYWDHLTYYDISDTMWQHNIWNITWYNIIRTARNRLKSTNANVFETHCLRSKHMVYEHAGNSCTYAIICAHTHRRSRTALWTMLFTHTHANIWGGGSVREQCTLFNITDQNNWHPARSMAVSNKKLTTHVKNRRSRRLYAYECVSTNDL